MNIEELKQRIDDLIGLADSTLATKHQRYDSDYLRTEAFSEFRTASLSYLRNVFGVEHPYYIEFNRNVTDISPYMTEHGRGILMAARNEIYGGWLFSVKSLISSEIFSDFLEMADYLLKEGYKDASAVMIGSVLEEHIRHLCISNSVPIELEKGDRFVPKKADLMNSDLASIGLYNKLDQKSIVSWLDLRNKAAHGKYGEYTKEQVELMYQGVLNFISRTS